MILPAFLLFYLIAANATIKKKIISLVSALAVLAAVSLSWPLIVDNIPASKRPYIGSSQTNSVLELAFGYNGIQRLTGQNSGGGQGGSNGEASKEMSSSDNSSTQNQAPPNQSSSSNSLSDDKSSNGNMTAPPSNGEMPSGGQGGLQAEEMAAKRPRRTWRRRRERRYRHRIENAIRFRNVRNGNSRSAAAFPTRII